MTAITTEPRQVLLDSAKRLAEIAEVVGLRDLASGIEAETERRLSDAKVRVVVLGEIKHGKSSLVNALAGTSALPTGVTPTTGAVVVVHTGTEPGRYLVGPDGSRKSIDEARFVELAKGKPGTAAEGTLELVVEHGKFDDAVELVDTPGINDIAAYRSAVSRGELPRADVLVLVLDATQLLNRTEMAFLRDAVASVGGLTDSGARLLIAVNRIDLVDAGERFKLVDYLDKELGAIEGARRNGEAVYELFLTDARTAGKPDADAGDASEPVAAVRRLRTRIAEIAAGRDKLLPNRARANLLRSATLLSHNAAISARAFSLQLDALKREIQTLKREFADHRADMGEIRTMLAQAREAVLSGHMARLEQFRLELGTSVDACIEASNLRSLSSFLPGSIHDAFLQFAQQESERLRIELEEATRKAIHTHGEQARRRLAQATLRLGFRGPTIYLDPPSIAMEASLVAIGLAGTAVMYFGSVVPGMLMTIAGPLATVVLREKSLRDARARARAELPSALEKAGAALQEQVRTVVDHHLAAVDEHLVLANVALGQQLTQVLDRAAAVLDGSERGEPLESLELRRVEAKRQLHDAEHELTRIRQRLLELRLG